MINLVKFKQYLSRSAIGNDSPVSIKAKDLDDNFLAVTVNDSTRGVYSCDHTPNGTELVFRAYDTEAAWQELTVSDGQGGTKTLSVLGTNPDDGTGGNCLTPFHICVRPNPGTPDSFLWGVSQDSVIFTDSTGETSITLTGIISGNYGWNSLTGSLAVWVEYAFDPDQPEVPTTAIVTSGSSLPSSPTGGQKLVGYITGGSSPSVQQIMVGAQRFIIQCMNGLPIAMIVPY